MAAYLVHDRWSLASAEQVVRRIPRAPPALQRSADDLPKIGAACLSSAPRSAALGVSRTRRSITDALREPSTLDA